MNTVLEKNVWKLQSIALERGSGTEQFQKGVHWIAPTIRNITLVLVSFVFKGSETG